jgi:hypothetical protein
MIITAQRRGRWRGLHFVIAAIGFFFWGGGAKGVHIRIGSFGRVSSLPCSRRQKGLVTDPLRRKIEKERLWSKHLAVPSLMTLGKDKIS